MRYSNFFAEAFTTDFMILAKNTMQVAAAKKNSAGTARAADARFFPHMQSCAGYYRFHTAAAGTENTIWTVHCFCPVNSAAVWADVTVSH